ncbi:MAG TPA: hypothetical protein VI033_03290 [Candidatus Nitrosopolaris sp.]
MILVKFSLELDLGESYISGTAIEINDNEINRNQVYNINIQQGNESSLIAPNGIEINLEREELSISFGNANNQDIKKILIKTNRIEKKQQDMIELYVKDDNDILQLANNLPAYMTILN